MPVTFFIFVVLELFSLTITVLKAKPKQNEVINPKMNIEVFFILNVLKLVKELFGNYFTILNAIHTYFIDLHSSPFFKSDV